VASTRGTATKAHMTNNAMTASDYSAVKVG
jgi:hypothetical protein